MHSNKRKFILTSHSGVGGFTLIELSIVLLIIGLITAGIVVAQAMIKQSKLMSVIVDEQKYVKAAQAFRDKYNALPGDMVNATNYWGTSPLGCAAASSSITPTTATCNGNGNGFIDSDDSAASGSITSWETFLAWQHLADAGFIQGIYTGATGPCSAVAQLPGVNSPAGKLDNSGFQWTYGTPNGISQFNNYFTGSVNYQQYLWFGGTGCDNYRISLLTGPDAAAIDQKIDDGYPNSGAVLGGNSQSTSGYVGCGNAVQSVTGAWITLYMTDTLPRCTMLFKVSW